MNKFSVSSLSCLLLVLLLGACARPASEYHPVTDAVPRESTLGFSVTPPPGTAWFERHHDESLLYLKRTRPQHYSIATRATEIHLEKAFQQKRDFHDYVKSLKELSQPPSSYRNVEFRYADVDDLSPFCVRYMTKYEDHGAKIAGGQSYIKVKRTGILCMHPESPRNGIDMYYQERSLSSYREPSFQKEGEQFLSSLRFQSVVN